MKITNEHYEIAYNSKNDVVTFEGVLRLHKLEDDDPVVQLLSDIINQSTDMITVDLRRLLSLNNTALDLLSWFVIKLRYHYVTKLVVKGSKNIIWQQRSFSYFQQLMPGLIIQWV
jgi:hypothetical protein